MPLTGALTLNIDASMTALRASTVSHRSRTPSATRPARPRVKQAEKGHADDAAEPASETLLLLVRIEDRGLGAGLAGLRGGPAIASTSPALTISPVR